MKLEAYDNIKRASVWGITQINRVNSGVLNHMLDSSYFVSKKDILEVEKSQKGQQEWLKAWSVYEIHAGQTCSV